MDNKLLNKRWTVFGLLAAAFLVIYFAGSALAPFLISFIIAYILDPLVDWLESFGLPRTAAIFFFLACLLLLFAGGILFLFPIIRLQVENMAKDLPGYIQTAQELIMPWISRFVENPEKVQAVTRETMMKLGNLPLKIVGSLATVSWNAVSGFVSFILAAVKLVIIPVATFYLLRDINKIKKNAYALVPRDMTDTVSRLAERLHIVLSNFVRGQLTVVCILAIIYSVGLFLVGIPLSLPIGIMAGLANIVPYLGLILGLMPTLILSYLQFHDAMHPLMVCLVFGVAQALDGAVITPKIVGDKIGLHPVAIMVAILLGGQLLGFTGILVAVPAAAAVNVFWTEWLYNYKKSETYLGTGKK
jgi:sporulation integral membrane protein YtvI